MQVIRTFGHLLGGTLLVAGTSIGVGMLALPVATSASGFIPAVVVYIICWLFMLATGLLVLEACIWMPKDANLITMSDRLLGKGGRTFCWILYLFLFSCLMIAHVSGGGEVVSQITGGLVPSWSAMILYVLVFSPVVYLGTHSVDRLNIVMISGVAISYLLFIFNALPQIDTSLLVRKDWSKAWAALPVVFTAFGYQSLIPTLVTYMNRNIARVRLAIILGTSIPLLIYIVWEFLILGIVPFEGGGGLAEALAKGSNAVLPLQESLGIPSLISIGRAFAFFSLTTSYMGISIAFLDFLADGFKVQKKGWNKIGLCLLIFGLPTIISLIYPDIFLSALSHAGGIGVALLLGAMPIAMVWSGRYFKGHSLHHQQLRGGRAVLAILMAFVIFELFFEFIY